MMYAKNIKNLDKVARESDNGVRLYYSLNENAVYTTDAIDRFHITTFIRRNTEDEIEHAVNRWLNM